MGCGRQHAPVCSAGRRGLGGGAQLPLQALTLSRASGLRRRRGAGHHESARVDELFDPADEVVDNETYGGEKALCEAAAEAAMPGRLLNLRRASSSAPGTDLTAFAHGRGWIAAGGDVLGARGAGAGGEVHRRAGDPGRAGCCCCCCGLMGT